ncbi:TIGR03013 family XrtA/PEP-CTERM system glycosyltransferase [Thermodesulfatator atlanticus]|uniref:TIGR03013 family XrtA/PEP-CTERM system glycosyltransferase n=1 Tax=Thermodesulfatator atlanticus TaxID=501497 RepID=UPI0003B70A06|nr:TIGR03013 family XrtA/PEP-CTERM system glycosyltransferase [Thermodesulfatator atlanticus]
MIWLFHRYYPARKLLFFISETFLIFAASLIAFYIHDGYITYDLAHWPLFFKIFFVTFMFQLWLYYFDLYTFRREDSLWDMFLRLLQSIGLATFLIGIVYYFFPKMMISNWSFMIFLFFVIVLAISWRLLYFYVLKQGYLDERIAFVGFSSLAEHLMEEIDRQLDCGFCVAAIFTRDKDYVLSAVKNFSFFPKVQIKTDFKKIFDFCHKNKIKQVVVCIEDRRGKLPVSELLECRMKGIDVVEGETFYEHLTGKILVEKIRPSWLIFHGGFYKSRRTLFLKRVLGLLVATAGLIILSPIALLIAILIKLDSPGPVLFVQERVGKDGKVFKLYKFRSMRTDAEKDAPKWASKNDPRVTRVGRVIRKLRLDEIPQMWNVIKGDMSFVGPRPERPFFVERLRKKIPYYDQRHTVLPGITGWAQICYPYGASDEDALEKLKYDLYYIKYMSVMFDLYIIFKTIKIVLFGEGAR